MVITITVEKESHNPQFVKSVVVGWGDIVVSVRGRHNSRRGKMKTQYVVGIVGETSYCRFMASNNYQRGDLDSATRFDSHQKALNAIRSYDRGCGRPDLKTADPLDIFVLVQVITVVPVPL
jgi:hypothetical protein